MQPYPSDGLTRTSAQQVDAQSHALARAELLYKRIRQLQGALSRATTPEEKAAEREVPHR
jgi:hypothetical protein